MAASENTELARERVDEIYRTESRRIFATLIRLLGDFDLAEDALQEAFRLALEQWPRDGVPSNPRAWLVSTGRFKAIDHLRRRARFDASLGVLAEQIERQAAQIPGQADEEIEDDRLRLIFTCCHPALLPDARVALTLREVCGLTTEEIAHAYLIAPKTLAQRIVRAKKKIRQEKIPYQVPSLEEIPERLDAVLQVIYLVFNEGYYASTGETLTRPDLSGEAIRLGRLLVELLPAVLLPADHTEEEFPEAGLMPGDEMLADETWDDETFYEGTWSDEGTDDDWPEDEWDEETPTGRAWLSEAYGLLALMLLHEARRATRVSAEGELVLLEDQDRSRWDWNLIAEGIALANRALESEWYGQFTLQAAILGTYVAAPSFAATDWDQIVYLFDRLLRVAPSPVVELNRAAAVAMRDGPEAGLALVDAVIARSGLDNFHLAHAARADLCRRLGRFDEARLAYQRALSLTGQEPMRRFLQRRLDSLQN